MIVFIFLIFVISVESCDFISHKDVCLEDCICSWCFNTSRCFEHSKGGCHGVSLHQQKCIGTIEHLWTGILGVVGVGICCYGFCLVGMGCFRVFQAWKRTFNGIQNREEYIEL